jgi:hypothetical protein
MEKETGPQHEISILVDTKKELSDNSTQTSSLCDKEMEQTEIMTSDNSTQTSTCENFELKLKKLQTKVQELQLSNDALIEKNQNLNNQLLALYKHSLEQENDIIKKIYIIRQYGMEFHILTESVKHPRFKSCEMCMTNHPKSRKYCLAINWGCILCQGGGHFSLCCPNVTWPHNFNPDQETERLLEDLKHTFGNIEAATGNELRTLSKLLDANFLEYH